MRKWVEDLLALQNVDMRIRNLKVKLDALPGERGRLDGELGSGKAELKDAKEGVQKVELQIKKSESSIGQVNEEIRKLQTQSGMVKKNTEYQAMMHEIELCKGRISDFETEEIGLLDEMEKAKAALKAAEKSLSEKERAIKAELQDFVQLESDIKKEIEELSAGRKALEGRLESVYLTAYRRLLAKGRGTPLSMVCVGGICSNCQLKLTPQTLHQAKKGEMALCDNCSHMLYSPDEETGA